MTLQDSMEMALQIFAALIFAGWYVRCLWWIFVSNMSVRWFLNDTFMGAPFVVFHAFVLIAATGYFIHWATN